MSENYNIYCDESCHLENDGIPVMVLGAVWCPVNSARSIAERIRELKKKNGLNHYFESKWIKISQAKLQFYLDLVDYFFDSKDLHFRAVLIPDKSKLAHLRHNQTHDEWYYKMYFTMLKQIFVPVEAYYIYLDIKDTNGANKIAKLHDVLCHNMYDFQKKIVKRVQLVRSHEIEQIQLADILIGSVCYTNRELTTSSAKMKVAERVRERSGYSLKQSTLLKEDKFNIFRWEASEVVL
jgi:hypothetical protein